MSPHKIERTIRALGWSVERTHGGHYVCRHPDAAYPVYAAATPSCHLFFANLKAEFRRALRAKRSKETA
jgi:predicted RNA binding protein YcfA (HicA-like mRNA interferase family)